MPRSKLDRSTLTTKDYAQLFAARIRACGRNRYRQAQEKRKIAAEYGLSHERVCQIVGLVIPRLPATSPWTQERSQALATLWSEGLSLDKIGAKMGITRNAVCGRARRMKLPARPVPPNFVKHPQT